MPQDAPTFREEETPTPTADSDRLDGERQVTVWSGLRLRILVASMICAAISLFVMNVLMVRGMIEAMAYRVVGFNEALMAGAEGERCRASPSTWMMQPDANSYVFAYDQETYRSQNPKAPPIEQDIVNRLRAGDKRALMFNSVDGEWGQMVSVLSSKGPCSLLLSGWQPRSDIKAKAILAFLALLVVSLVFTAGIAMVLVVRPLLARIADLRDSALTVGGDGYREARKAHPADELQEVALLLDKAHERIRSDAELLERRNRALAEHLSNVAHDMRTPIASLQLALERMVQRTSAEDEREELVTAALLDAVYIGALTDNLRIAAQLKDGLNPAADGAEVDLCAVVDAVESRLRILAKRKGVSLDAARPDAAIVVGCRPVMAEQMLQNLVQNAVAYGEEGGHVSILLEATAGGFRLQVLDDGPGVPPDALPRLGERTFRTDEARTRDAKGTGLGLAIAGEVVSRCGFELAFSSIEDGGLRVVVEGRCVGAADSDDEASA